MYGCYDRQPYKDALRVQDGWEEAVKIAKNGAKIHTRIPRMIEVPFRNSTDCNYRHTELGRNDESCVGCKHRI